MMLRLLYTVTIFLRFRMAHISAAVMDLRWQLQESVAIPGVFDEASVMPAQQAAPEVSDSL
jgi:hypothetical protein